MRKSVKVSKQHDSWQLVCRAMSFFYIFMREIIMRKKKFFIPSSSCVPWEFNVFPLKFKSKNYSKISFSFLFFPQLCCHYMIFKFKSLSWSNFISLWQICHKGKCASSEKSAAISEKYFFWIGNFFYLFMFRNTHKMNGGEWLPCFPFVLYSCSSSDVNEKEGGKRHHVGMRDCVWHHFIILWRILRSLSCALHCLIVIIFLHQVQFVVANKLFHCHKSNSRRQRIFSYNNFI